MTMYAGQNGSHVELLPSEIELGLTAEDLFTEADRRAAAKASREDNPVMPFDLYQRLSRIASTPYNHQAQFILDELHNKALKQGHDAIAHIEPGDAGPGLNGKIELGPYLATSVVSSTEITVDDTLDQLAAQGRDPYDSIEKE